MTKDDDVIIKKLERIERKLSNIKKDRKDWLVTLVISVFFSTLVGMTVSLAYSGHEIALFSLEYLGLVATTFVAMIIPTILCIIFLVK